MADHPRLPPPLAAHLRTILRRTKLTRRERAHARATITSLFADRLADGESVQDILNRYDQPRTEAAALTADFRHRRSWPARIRLAFVRWLTRFLVVFFITYAFLAWRFYSRAPTITRNFAAEYNAPIATLPETDRAWPLYQMSGARFEPTSDPGDPFWNRWPNIRPGEPLWQQVGPCLERNREALEMLRLATKRPALGFMISDAPPPPVDPAAAHPPAGAAGSANPCFQDWSLTYLGTLRQSARWLKLDAPFAAHSLDRTRLFDDLMGLFRIAGHAREHPITIGDLTSVAIFTLACDTMGEALADRPDLLTDSDLAVLDHEVSSYADGSITFRAEAFVEDFLQRTFSDDGNGDGHFTAEGIRNAKRMQGEPNARLSAFELVLSPLVIANPVTRKDLSDKHDHLLRLLQADFSIPAWQRGELAVDLEVDRIRADPKLSHRYGIVVVLESAFVRTAQAMEQASQLRGAARLALAVTRYRLHHGDYPPDLNVLVPGFLPEIPVDQFDGGPIKYAFDSAEPRLYSVGDDRDDDGGLCPPARNADGVRRWKPPSRASLAKDGDWLLWPIRPDPPPPEPPPEPPVGEESPADPSE